MNTQKLRLRPFEQTCVHCQRTRMTHISNWYHSGNVTWDPTSVMLILSPVFLNQIADILVWCLFIPVLSLLNCVCILANVSMSFVSGFTEIHTCRTSGPRALALRAGRDQDVGRTNEQRRTGDWSGGERGGKIERSRGIYWRHYWSKYPVLMPQCLVNMLSISTIILKAILLISLVSLVEANHKEKGN